MQALIADHFNTELVDRRLINCQPGPHITQPHSTYRRLQSVLKAWVVVTKNVLN